MLIQAFLPERDLVLTVWDRQYIACHTPAKSENGTLQTNPPRISTVSDDAYVYQILMLIRSPALLGKIAKKLGCELL